MTNFITQLKYSIYTIFHPFDGFYRIKHEKKGGRLVANVFLALYILTNLITNQFTGYFFNFASAEKTSFVESVMTSVLPIFLWVIANWCLTTLMDGEGSLRDVYVTVCYSLVPYIIINIPLTFISNFLSLEESSLYYLVFYFSVVWTLFLIFCGMITIHQYSFLKNVFTCILTIVGIGILIFIGLLFYSLIQRIFGFAYAIFSEVTFRM